MSKITSLTEEQIALMEVVKDKWINLSLLGGDELDQDAARTGIEWMYSMTKLKKPKVIFVDSPLAVQYAANILLIEGSSDQVRGQVYDQVRGQVSGQVYDQVRDQVRDQVYDQVRDQVYGQVSGQVSGQVYGQVRDQVSGQVYGQVRDQVRDQVYGQKMTQFYWAYEALGWRADDGAWFDFFAQIGVAKHKDLKKYLDYLQSGVFFAVFLTDYAIVCRRPQATRRDERQLLSNDQKPAIEWRDGYKLYYLHGVAFEFELWDKIVSQKINLENLAEITNADQRAVAVQFLRPDLLLKQVGAKLVNTGKKGTRLYEVKNFMDTGDTEYCIRMTHPSIKDKEFIEWVEPKVGAQKDADFAQAVAFQITKKEYLEAIEA